MEIAATVANQILIMFLLMAVGAIVAKLKYFSTGTIKEVNNFLIVFVISCAVINAFQMEYNARYVKNLGIILVLSVVAHLIGIAIATFIFKKKDLKSKLSIFGSVYSNSSFMALPLLSSVFGTEGIFYGAAYIGVFNIFIWSHGVDLIDPNKIKGYKDNFIKIIKNPVVFSVFVGIFLYVTNIRFHQPVNDVLGYIASLNTPLAMILLGVFITKCNLLDAFKSGRIYLISFLRLLLIPVILLFIVKGITLFVDLDKTLVLALLISVGCPTAGTMAMMSERFDIDTGFAVKSITVCTILSIVTIPFLMIIAQKLI